MSQLKKRSLRVGVINDSFKLSEDLVAWLSNAGALVLGLSIGEGTQKKIRETLSFCDGIIFTGEGLIAPEKYGEMPEKPEFSGNKKQDSVEIEAFQTAFQLGKPVLGINRGFHLLNVAFGGSLYQSFDQSSFTERASDSSDQLQLRDHKKLLHHPIRIEPTAQLQKWLKRSKIVLTENYPQVSGQHIQGIKELGRGLEIEARSLSDDLIEAFSFKKDSEMRFVYGTQFYPEKSAQALGLAQALLESFLREALRRKI